MKALKSDLAKSVLADPHATGLLRFYLANRWTAGIDGGASRGMVIEVRSEQGSTVRVKPVVVRKAD